VDVDVELGFGWASAANIGVVSRISIIVPRSAELKKKKNNPRKVLTLEFDIAMDEADAVHPAYGATDLGPYTAEDGFAEAGPCSVGIDEGEEVAAGEVGEDEDVVC
jgi:hypothetical protein